MNNKPQYSDERLTGRERFFPLAIVVFLLVCCVAALWLLKPDIDHVGIAFCSGACVAAVGTLAISLAVIGDDRRDD